MARAELWSQFHPKKSAHGGRKRSFFILLYIDISGLAWSDPDLPADLPRQVGAFVRIFLIVAIPASCRQR